MTCPACTLAESDPWRDEFAAGCIRCDARALALVALSANRETLGKVFGARLDEGLQMIREWKATMRQVRARA